jgi:hypothetical protein
VSLLNVPEMLKEFRGLVRKTGSAGRDKVDHRAGAHDDMANVCAGVLVELTVKGGRQWGNLVGSVTESTTGETWIGIERIRGPHSEDVPQEAYTHPHERFEPMETESRPQDGNHARGAVAESVGRGRMIDQPVTPAMPMLRTASGEVRYPVRCVICHEWRWPANPVTPYVCTWCREQAAHDRFLDQARASCRTLQRPSRTRGGVGDLPATMRDCREIQRPSD